MASPTPAFLTVGPLDLPKLKLLSNIALDTRLEQSAIFLENLQPEKERQRLLDVTQRHRHDGGKRLRVRREVSSSHERLIEEGPIEGQLEIVAPSLQQFYGFVGVKISRCPPLNVDGCLTVSHALDRALCLHHFDVPKSAGKQGLRVVEGNAALSPAEYLPRIGWLERLLTVAARPLRKRRECFSHSLILPLQ